MRVVDRKTFLELPPGTLYAKFGGSPTEERCIDLGPLCIKAAHRGNPPLDWYCTELPEWPEHKDCGELIDVYDRLVAGEDLAPDWWSSTDDGLFDEGQFFAVLSKADVDALIERLQEAKQEAFASEAAPA